MVVAAQRRVPLDTSLYLYYSAVNDLEIWAVRTVPAELPCLSLHRWVRRRQRERASASACAPPRRRRARGGAGGRHRAPTRATSRAGVHRVT